MKTRRLDLLEEKRDFLIKHNASVEEVAEIERQIEMSKRGRRSKNKGGSYEQHLAKKIGEKYPMFKLVRTKQSGGAHKEIANEALRGDLANMSSANFPFHIEAKNHKTWSLKAWWKQAEEDCMDSKIPLVMFHQEQQISGGKVVQKADDFVMIRLNDFLNVTEKFIKEEQK